VPVAVVLAAMFVTTGCVRRTITITSEPSGALVWLNDREIGRTPVDVDFLHYGTYDVRLVKESYEPLITAGRADPPLWDNVGLDLVAELLPLDLESAIHWHYVLEPAESDLAKLEGPLVERARAARTRLATEIDAEPPAPAPGPDRP
jgi:hypothetical protein